MKAGDSFCDVTTFCKVKQATSSYHPPKYLVSVTCTLIQHAKVLIQRAKALILQAKVLKQHAKALNQHAKVLYQCVKT